MGALFWFGGCALGLVLLELTQRRFFPGEPLLLWEWLRRTRRRESIEGGPASWAALFDSSWESTGDKLAPRIPHDLLNLKVDDESALREHCLHEKRPSTRTVLLCLLADLAARHGNREEARHLLSEAEDIISLVWEPHLRQARFVYELVLRLKSLFLYQEGQIEEANQALNQVEKLFGWREWVILARAEVALLADQTRTARALTDQILGSLSRQSTGCVHDLEHSALLLKAESFLREHDLDGLDWTLHKIQSRTHADPMDRLTFLRFRVELAASRNDLPAAWRSVSGLHNCLTSHPNHPGISRIYHLCCANCIDSRRIIRNPTAVSNWRRT